MGLFKKKSEFLKTEFEKLIEWNEPNGEGCIASDKITKEGFKVGYMYRNKPSDKFPDSGWRFYAGNEDDEYSNNPENHKIYSLNTICNYDKDIIQYLYSKPGTKYIRISHNEFELDDGSKPIFIDKQN